MAFGVNDNREVVGTYMVGSGNNAKSFGFIWSRDFGFRTVNDPHGSGATTLNGINNAGDLVGFYTDAKGNTDGLLVAHGHFRAPLAPPLTTTPCRPRPHGHADARPRLTPAADRDGPDPLLTVAKHSHWPRSPATNTAGWPGTPPCSRASPPRHARQRGGTR